MAINKYHTIKEIFCCFKFQFVLIFRLCQMPKQYHMLKCSNTLISYNTNSYFHAVVQYKIFLTSAKKVCTYVIWWFRVVLALDWFSASIFSRLRIETSVPQHVPRTPSHQLSVRAPTGCHAETARRPTQDAERQKYVFWVLFVGLWKTEVHILVHSLSSLFAEKKTEVKSCY